MYSHRKKESNSITFFTEKLELRHSKPAMKHKPGSSDSMASEFYVDPEKGMLDLPRPSLRYLFASLCLATGPSASSKCKKLCAPGKQTLEDICYDLCRVNTCLPQNPPYTVFKPEKLVLQIKLLGGAKFSLNVPPPALSPAQPEMTGSSEMNVNDVCVTNDPFIQLLPPSCRQVSEKASPLGLVSKLLPPGLISKNARYVGRSFWTWLCTVDDLTEKLVGKEWSDTETDLLRAFGPDYNNNAAYHNFDSDSVKVSLALRKVIETTCIGSKSQKLWRNSFNDAICEILMGFREERPLIESECISMRQWMRLRVITISTRPFFVLARADVGLPATVSKVGNPLDPSYPDLVASKAGNSLPTIRKVECLLQAILGLQNDILGWEKDSITNNPLSAIQILIKQGVHQAIAVDNVINVHNNLVDECVRNAQRMWSAPTDSRHIERLSEKKSNPFLGFFLPPLSRKESEEIQKYLKIIVGFAHGMAHWMAVSKRYLAH